MTNLRSLITASIFSALICVTSFIQVPSPIPFTLQIMTIFIISGILKTKTAFLSVVIYLLIGAVGLPVFSGFKGGLGALFGASGGYISGAGPTIMSVVCENYDEFSKNMNSLIKTNLPNWRLVMLEADNDGAVIE